MELLWVIRHGQTPHNVSDQLNGDLQRQVTLDETGRAQAAQAGLALAGEPIEVCFTSPFTRAVDTARIMLADRAVPMHVRPALSEVRFGDFFEGRTLAEYVGWMWEHGMFASPPGSGGECMAETLMRYHDEFMTIAGQPERVGLVVTHGSPVGFARRGVTYSHGEQLLPLLDAFPAQPYRIDAGKLAEGLTRAKARVTDVAMQDEQGRAWAENRGLAGSAKSA